MVSPFEYVIVLISIILGMGITQLITGMASLILRWDKVKLYWPHLVLVILVFIIHIQDWWATYALRSNTQWHLPMFLFIILYPVNLYILARILFPIRWSAYLGDLKAFYLDNYRKLFGFMIFLPVHSLVENCLIRGYALKDQFVQIILVLLFSLVIGLNKRDEWIHKVVATILAFLCIATLVIGWNEFIIAS